MVNEARLEDDGSGLAPASEGWFVVNVRDARWMRNERFGQFSPFEDRVDARFPEFGINIHVVRPGEPNGLYHRESNQEDFLVLAGECLLLVEGEERRLGPWDFVHCPPETEHVFVGVGDGPCAILMVGTRDKNEVIRYPVSELALRHGAGVETETGSAREAYAGSPPIEPGKLDGWDRLPWARASAD
jgi:uncharacterized cupin superfamily protein